MNKKKRAACLWMSFCDPSRQTDNRFLRVIITKTLGLAHAVDETHAMGINPCGEILSYEIDPSDVAPELFDRLLSKPDIRDAGYIQGTR